MSVSSDREALLRQADAEALCPIIPARSNRQGARLSFAQRRLWFLQKYQPQSAAYNLIRAFELRGPLDRGALQAAFDALLARHDVLRTAFVERMGEDEPTQVVDDGARILMVEQDLQGLRGADVDARIQALIGDAAACAFDLSRAPLIRVTLVCLAPDTHILLMVSHHAVSDGWSNPILARELAHGYRAALKNHVLPADKPLPRLPIQYADFAQWQRETLADAESNHSVAYWKTYLAGDVPALSLPTDRPRPAVPTLRGARQAFGFPPALVAQLTTFCRTAKCTPFVVLLAAWQVLLGRYSGQRRFAVGVPHAGRGPAELDHLIGFFVNTQVYIADLPSGTTLRTLAARVRAEAREAMNHADVPLEVLLDTLPVERDTSRTPIFQTMFNLQAAADGGFALEGLTITPVPVAEQSAKFELTMDIVVRRQAGGFAARGELEYSTDLFDTATASRITRHYVNLVGALLAQPDTDVALLPFLDARERTHQLVDLNQTAREAMHGTDLVTRFEAQVARAPERIALLWDDSALSFRDLNRCANRLAHRLMEMDVGAETRVAVCLSRGALLPIALLAVLKAGAAYIPLDPAQPVARNALILSQSGATLILTDASVSASTELLLDDARADTRAEIRAIVLDAEDLAIEETSNELRAGWDHNPGLPYASRHLAYVLYTSGSTGVPKGVQIERGALANFLLAIQDEVRLDAEDVLLAVTTIGFDIAALELYLPLLRGAKVVIAKQEQTLDPAALIDLWHRHGVTAMQATPATWRMLISRDSPAWHGLAAICGGEALGGDLARQLLGRGVRLVNVYGPTETTIWSTSYPVPGQSAALPDTTPIGRPIGNNTVYVLNDALDPVPAGVTGELYIGGAGLARGYAGQPRLTAKAFVPNPFVASGVPGDDAGGRLYRTGDLARWRADDVLEFLGRRDFQVKLRGYRIELGEIEAALRKVAGAQDAVVGVRKGGGAEDLLVAWLQSPGSAPGAMPGAMPGTALDAGRSAALARSLREWLPAYMVPAVYVPMSSFPLNANGKVDRRALPDPVWVVDGARRSPESGTEITLAAIWSEVLGVEKVFVEDDVFHLGAQSLQLVAIHSRLMARLPCELAIVDLFQAPILRDMAARVDASRPAGQAGGKDALSFMNDLLDAYD